MTHGKVEYAGKDLEAMDFAVAYHTWILDLIKPHLGKNIVEVGAGTGSFSRLLLETAPDRLSLVEPSAMFEALSADFRSTHGQTKIHLFHDLFSNVAENIRRDGPPDTILYVNVLEHIDDDVGELQIVHDTLSKGGKVILFVPALPLLFSRFDRQLGHFRRYKRAELKEKSEAVGFKTLILRWFDLPGVLPWFVKFRMLRSMKVEPGAVQLYDRLAVPFIRPIENLIPPPFGKNLLLVAQKT